MNAFKNQILRIDRYYKKNNIPWPNSKIWFSKAISKTNKPDLLIIIRIQNGFFSDCNKKANEIFIAP
jgi:hypothetical protein